MKNKLVILFLLLQCGGFCAFAQVKIVALGSSTTMGAAATSNDSAWTGRLQTLFRKNTGPLNPDTVVYQVGDYGYTTYHVMPDGYVSPIPGRPAPVPGKNITTALSYHPDVVIINLPSNDVATLSAAWVTPLYNKKETMDNFRMLYQMVVATGANCFITTTQPRNDLTTDQRQMQRDLVDSIRNNFGINAINFWDDLVTQDGTNGLRDEVRHLGYSDADFHLINYGHELIFNQVKSKQLFAMNAPLPLSLIDFSIQQQDQSVLLKWRTAGEEANTIFGIERSANNREYATLASQQGRGGSQQTDYAWTDVHPLPGKNFYRLKITETGKTRYSRVLEANGKPANLAIEKLYSSGTTLVAEISSRINGPALVRITSLAGVVLQTRQVQLERNGTTFTLPIPGLASGEYVFSLSSEGQGTVTQRFLKMK